MKSGVQFRPSGRNLVLAGTVALFLIWVVFNYSRLMGDQNGVLRLVLGMLFALLIVFRAKPAGSAERRLSPRLIPAAAVAPIDAAGVIRPVKTPSRG